ncbi:DNA methyltransferase [Aromatoleum toluclasticum]|uniref:DNA methyltransferase n=1 Tax=Aromatoleum toluclasticum TaxID=92003 RepID=UPI0003A853BD|nr:DNA methyltransferase [Aromatoleum toluclasticum]
MMLHVLDTMFAEDVGLLPARSFTELLLSLKDSPLTFAPMLESLWQNMNSGGFSPILRGKVLRFNGGLFSEATAIPLDRDQLELLLKASEADWRYVEPAIFGTLLERALAFEQQGKHREAVAEIRAFHRHLCEVRVLDPACGSGNFLYVTLEHMKRLEGEVLNLLHDLGESQGLLELEGVTVDPHQFLGLEINPRAAKIAEMVLWIGYLQWHFRTHGTVNPPEPVLRDFKNIEHRDALIAYEREEFVTDEAGRPVARWDGVTYKTSPVTGEPIPDETAQVVQMRYVNPKKAEWPQADYIVGNPPFIGCKLILPLRTSVPAFRPCISVCLNTSNPNVNTIAGQRIEIIGGYLGRHVETGVVWPEVSLASSRRPSQRNTDYFNRLVRMSCQMTP